MEGLTRELDVLGEARRLGVAGLPQARARTLSGPEAMLVQRVEKARQDYVDWAVLRLGVLDQDIARHDAALAAVIALREADREFEREAAALLAEREATLRTLRETATATRAEHADFIARNRLAREAVYPGPAARLLLAGLLVLMVVLEGLANAYFFAAGVESGLLGGFVYAALFAAINVTLAYVLGRHGVRELAHVAPARKTLGALALAVAVGAMVAIGLAIAHVRDALTAQVPDATDAALRNLLAHPFALSGVPSWALFVVSVLFAAFALVDGLGTDDPYPGYGHSARRARLAADDHEAELDEVRVELEAAKIARLQALDNDLGHAQAALAVLEGLIADKRATGSRLANALRDADNALDALLRRFRTENELHPGAARRGRPALRHGPRATTTGLARHRHAHGRGHARRAACAAGDGTRRGAGFACAHPGRVRPPVRPPGSRRASPSRSPAGDASRRTGGRVMARASRRQAERARRQTMLGVLALVAALAIAGGAAWAWYARPAVALDADLCPSMSESDRALRAARRQDRSPGLAARRSRPFEVARPARARREGARPGCALLSVFVLGEQRTSRTMRSRWSSCATRATAPTAVRSRRISGTQLRRAVRRALHRAPELAEAGGAAIHDAREDLADLRDASTGGHQRVPEP